MICMAPYNSGHTFEASAPYTQLRGSVLGRHSVLVAVTSDPYQCSITGGMLRAWKSIRAYQSILPVEVYYLPVYGRKCKPLIEIPRGLVIRKLRLAPPLDRLPGSRASWIFRLIPSRLLQALEKTPGPPKRVGAVIGLHETSDILAVTKALAERWGVRSGVLLQLPPFYGSRGRLQRIREAFTLHYKLLYQELPERVLRLVNLEMWGAIHSARVGSTLLEGFDLILAVSRSIPYEMGGPWASRVIALDPGVTLGEEVVHIAERIRGMSREEWVFYGGRPDAEKGVVEAFIAFSKISKRRPEMRMLVTGHTPGGLRDRLMRLAKRLGVGGNIVFKGPIRRRERLELVARSRVVLYPSHVDSYSLTVHESLLLGTPVVAYRIPALEIHYGGLEGVELVEEGDVRDLADTALSVTGSAPIHVEAPRPRSWESIMGEEVEIVKRLLLPNE